MRVAKHKDLGTPVRTSPETYKRLKWLASKAARDGWHSLGIERDDPPTYAAIIDAALTRLKEAAEG